MAVGAPEQILSGKYRLERELGRGGMGAVWLAQHLTLHSPVAIKLMDPEIAQSPEGLSRFLREAQSAAALRSPHVVQILDHGVDAGVPFIVMELLEGESLAARLGREGRLSPEYTARVMTQVARAMTKAHDASVVHRDLKPDNIFLVKNDEEEIAKVLDFGIAKAKTHGLAQVSGNTRTGSVLGTPYYMSPEQAEGAKNVDHRSDVWAMGVIAFECLIGERPFDAETLGSLLLAICARDMPVPSRRGPVPAGFDGWFARACARDVTQRFASAREAAAELRAVCAGEPMPSSKLWPPPSSASAGAVSASSLASTTAQLGMSSSREPSKKSPAPWIALGVVGLAIVAGGAFVAFGAAHEPNVTAASAARSAAPPPFVPQATPATQAPVASASATEAPASAPSSPLAANSAKPQIKPQPRPRPAPVVDKPKPAPAVAPAPSAPAARPRVNLGI